MNDEKIVDEFSELLLQSQSLFQALRDVPQFGRKHWQPYFTKTFEIYSKLWKFQKLHRAILLKKYGLKRIEIGEIASKIAQLYYHYYLRTSEAQYLNDSYLFYESIRYRNYFGELEEQSETSIEVAVKNLRYYARFIVVCFLLKREDVLIVLQEELRNLVGAYSKGAIKSDVSKEWFSILEELDAFSTVYQLNVPKTVIDMRIRQEESAVAPPDSSSPLFLREAIIISNKSKQIKFSELTLDSYRMIQILERVHDYGHNGSGKGKSSATKSPNPHKYLLFRPSFSNMLLFLATAAKELATDSAMLIYISADGFYPQTENKPIYGYDKGGVVVGSTRSVKEEEKSNKCYLYPHDLLPLSRKPMFVILDSDNAMAFSDFRSPFEIPLLIMMSPVEFPTPDVIIENEQTIGSPFTFFLTSPIEAITCFCGIMEVSQLSYKKLDELMLQFYSTVTRLFGSIKNIDKTYIKFMADDMLRILICRFVFCCVVTSLMKILRKDEYRPTSIPEIPKSLWLNPALEYYVLEMAQVLDVEDKFIERN